MNKITSNAEAPTSLLATRAEFVLLGLALVWGTSHVFTKTILTTHTPFFYTSMRFGLAAVFFGLAFARKRHPSNGREIRQGILLGLCSFVGITCYSFGMVFTTASKAGFITGLYLVFTPLLAYVLFNLKPSADHLAGLLVAVFGFGLLSFPATGAQFNWGDGLILCAALAWAAHIAATSAFARQSEVRTLAAVQVVTVAVLALTAHLLLRNLMTFVDLSNAPSWLLIERRSNQLTLQTLGLISYMAIVVTFVAALAQTWAQGKVATTQAALLYALEPVTAAAFAWLAFGESLNGRGLLGAGLIVAGVLVSRLGLLGSGGRSAEKALVTDN